MVRPVFQGGACSGRPVFSSAKHSRELAGEQRRGVGYRWFPTGRLPAADWPVTANSVGQRSPYQSGHPVPGNGSTWWEWFGEPVCHDCIHIRSNYRLSNKCWKLDPAMPGLRLCIRWLCIRWPAGSRSLGQPFHGCRNKSSCSCRQTRRCSCHNHNRRPATAAEQSQWLQAK